LLNFFNEILFTYGEPDEKVIRVKALFLILLTITIAFGVTKILKALTHKFMDNNPDSKGRIDSFVQIQKYIISFIAFLVCLQFLKVDLTSIIVSASAVLVVISFGLQSLFTDFISGVIILFDGTIKSNDIIEVDKTIGKVEKITLRNTTLITRDDYVIIMPNRKFISENVTNWSHNNNTMRFKVTVGVAYGTDTRLVSKLMMKCADEHSLLSKSKKGFVGFKDFGDSALIFELYFWTTEIFRIEVVKSDLRFMIDKVFRDNGITIPFPQRDLHIIQPSEKKADDQQVKSQLDSNKTTIP
jgi:small-conductance mechanosensitive channel